MSEFQPVQFEIAGTPHRFERDKTIVHIYRYETDQPLNHIEAEEYGTQRTYIFHAIPAMMFLSGQEIPGHSFNKKEVQQITSEMDKRVGWEAELRIRDQAPEDVRERYIRLGTAILKAEHVFVPRSWYETQA